MSTVIPKTPDEVRTYLEGQATTDAEKTKRQRLTALATSVEDESRGLHEALDKNSLVGLRHHLDAIRAWCDEPEDEISDTDGGLPPELDGPPGCSPPGA